MFETHGSPLVKVKFLSVELIYGPKDLSWTSKLLNAIMIPRIIYFEDNIEGFRLSFGSPKTERCQYPWEVAIPCKFCCEASVKQAKSDKTFFQEI